MQKTSFKIVVLSLFVSILCSTNVSAQGKKKAPAKKSTNSSANPFGGGGATPAAPSSANPFGGGGTTPAAPANANPFGGGGASSKTTGGANPFGGGGSSAQQGGNQPPANRPANGKIPINIIPSATSNPLSDSIKPSLRNESAIIFNVKDRNPLPYDDIREDDAIYRQKLWEIIDAREKINEPFTYGEDNGSQLFFSILFKAIVEDSVVAFEDDKFRKPYIDINKFKARFSGGTDTTDVEDLDRNIIGRDVRTREFPIDSVYEFMVMKEIIFDKEASRLVHRIIGIAPMGPTILPSGKVIPGPHFPYFWVYYPDMRKTLAKKQVYNGKNMGARMTWEDYLENQHFSYYIVKTSMDNPKDQWLKEYVKDPLFRLLEGDKIKDKIFNYEQGLWAY